MIKRLIQVTGLSCLLFLGSCGLQLFNAPDSTPLMQAETAKVEIVVDLHDSIVELAKGLPEDQRLLVMAELATQMDSYARLSEATLEYLKAVGEVDWEGLFNQLKELYKQVRGGS